MNTLRTLGIVCFFLLLSSQYTEFAHAQGAPLGGSSLVLQDSSGKTITMQPPSGMSAAYTYQLPLAPGGTVPAGFVDAGNDTGQSVVWDGVAWVPSNFVAQKYGKVGLGFATIPLTMPFPITVAQTVGPNTNGLLDLGDASHHFGTLYVDNIVGASGFLSVWSRNAMTHTLTPLAAGDNISTSGSVFTTGSGSITSAGPLSAMGGIALIGTLTANGSSGSTGQVLTIDASGDPKWAAPANFLPAQAGNSGKVLMTDGTAATWQPLPSAGTVTSVDFSGGSTGLTATGGPITSSGTITLSGTLAITNGGTGANTASAALTNILPTQVGNNGKVLMTNGNAATWQQLPSAGTVTSIDISGGSTGLTATGGPITSSGTVTLSGTLAISNGGTGANTPSAALTNILPTQGGNSGKVLMTNGTAATWQTLPSAGTVTSVDISGGSTGLTATGGPITSSGTVTLSGTLAISNGGTGANSQSGALNNLLPDQSGNNGKFLETNGSNASWVSLPGSGTVTSVSVSAPSEFSVSGSPITTSGIITISKANENTNTVYAGPVSGAAAPPSFRSLVAADIPNNSANTTGTSAGFTGALSGDVTGTQGNTVVSSVGGSTAANVHAAEVAVSAATSTNTASTLVERDASGNFSAGTITATLNGNASTATTAGSATNFSGNLLGDVTGTQGSTVVSSVGGSTAANVHAAEVAVSAATSTNTASTLVERDASGNFSSGNINLGQVTLRGSGAGTSSIAAGAQGTTTINYTLPTSQPSANQVLTATAVSGSGPYAVALGWSTPSGGTGSISFVKKTADQNYTSSSLTNDTHLSLSITSSATYIFEGFLCFSDPNQYGLKPAIAFTVPSGSTIKFGVSSAYGINNVYDGSIVSASGTSSNTISIENGNAQETFVYVKGIVVTGSNSGTLQLKCARVGGSGTNNLVLSTNSYITATRVQ